MERIIYISTAPAPMEPEEIAALLAISRRNNAAAGITGLLIYHDASFLQVLEGEDPALSACLDRIARDPRHRWLIVLWRGAVAERAFPEWQMGYARLSDLCADTAGAGGPAVLSLHDLVDRGLGAGADPMVEQLVASFLGGFRDLGHGGMALRLP